MQGLTLQNREIQTRKKCQDKRYERRKEKKGGTFMYEG